MFHTDRTEIIFVLFAAACTALACGSAPTLDEIPSNADVTIETQNGRWITGKLVHADPEIVALRSDRGSGMVRVNRADIAAVQSGEAARELKLREIVVPAGTSLDVQLETTVDSQTSHVEDPVIATLASPVVIDGVTVAPSGSVLRGAVTAVHESGRVKGRAELGVRFNQLDTEAVMYEIRTVPLHWVAEATKGEDAAKIGLGAVAGAVVGGIAGGGKGAAVGSAVGAGGGSAVVLTTKGKEIRHNSGSNLHVQLAEPLSVAVPANS